MYIRTIVRIEHLVSCITQYNIHTSDVHEVGESNEKEESNGASDFVAGDFDSRLVSTLRSFYLIASKGERAIRFDASATRRYGGNAILCRISSDLL